jgi:hypothetical protein
MSIVYQPHDYTRDRVVWYGGESTQLHYEQEIIDKESMDGIGWNALAVRTLGGGIPKGMSEMHAEMQDYYNFCQAEMQNDYNYSQEEVVD